MSYPELLQAIQALDRDEKTQLLHVLEAEVGAIGPSGGDAALLARCFPPGKPVEIREPIFAPEAAAVLVELLDAEKRRA